MLFAYVELVLLVLCLFRRIVAQLLIDLQSTGLRIEMPVVAIEVPLRRAIDGSSAHNPSAAIGLLERCRIRCQEHTSSGVYLYGAGIRHVEVYVLQYDVIYVKAVLSISMFCCRPCFRRHTLLVTRRIDRKLPDIDFARIGNVEHYGLAIFFRYLEAIVTSKSARNVATVDIYSRIIRKSRRIDNGT